MKLHDPSSGGDKTVAANTLPAAPSTPVKAAANTVPVDNKPVPATASATANSFVVVEPTYTPKDTAAPATSGAIAEPVRALEAAAKFVERPDASLLPAPSASMQQSNPNAIQPAVNLAAEQKAQEHTKSSISGPKYTGEPISVNLKDVDLKDFFRLIHEISGLNVVSRS